MIERCSRHPFEEGQSRCRACGDVFCDECLVYSFGPNKPPYCVSCALAAAGVRSNAGRPRVMNRRELRRMEKEQRKTTKEQRKAAAPAQVEVTAVALPDAFGPEAQNGEFF